MTDKPVKKTNDVRIDLVKLDRQVSILVSSNDLSTKDTIKEAKKLMESIFKNGD